MLARRSAISHPLSGESELPLLIPSFSSKGFVMFSSGRAKSKHFFSENVYALSEFGQYPNNSVLISAYDLYFNYFNAPDLESDQPEKYLYNSQLVFLDSGGYELVSDYDSMEIKFHSYNPRPDYRYEQYKDVAEKYYALKRPLPLVITNFDYTAKGQPLELQIKLARNFFREFPDCLTDFILKPWTPSGKVVDPTTMSDTDFANLRNFDIIGVTEKELGRDLIDRLRRVARLRKGLDDANISSPIHIYGGLDPISTPLFFFAGAEIFDGTSWLRYAYQKGLAINREIYSIVSDLGVKSSREFNHHFVSYNNLIFLNNLTIALQQWIDYDGNNFNMFHPNIRENLKIAYNTMVSTIDLLKGEK